MDTNILIDGDESHARWVEIALGYLPEDVVKKEGANLAIIGVGCIGGCRLPQHYRKREIILLSDWIFPPGGMSEGDTVGQFFIITLLHEIAHAVCRHKSPKFDKLTPEENQAQEDEADSLALDWFNRHVELRDDEYLNAIQANEFRETVERYAALCGDIEKYKVGWHQNNSVPNES